MLIKITTDKDYKVMDGKNWIRTISKYDSYIVEVRPEEKKNAIKQFKKSINVKRMPKCFKVEEINLPEDNLLHTFSNGNIIYVVLNGRIVFKWSDDASINRPEDLTWDKEISDVFDSGVKLGLKLADLITGKIEKRK